MSLVMMLAIFGMVVSVSAIGVFGHEDYAKIGVTFNKKSISVVPMNGPGNDLVMDHKAKKGYIHSDKGYIHTNKKQTNGLFMNNNPEQIKFIFEIKPKGYIHTNDYRKLMKMNPKNSDYRKMFLG